MISELYLRSDCSEEVSAACVPSLSPPLQHLSISNGNIQVDASFMQTLWNVHPICSGSNVEEGNLKLTLSYLYCF